MTLFLCQVSSYHTGARPAANIVRCLAYSDAPESNEIIIGFKIGKIMNDDDDDVDDDVDDPIRYSHSTLLVSSLVRRKGMCTTEDQY